MIRLSALQEAAINICAYLFACIKQRVSLPVTEINAASCTKFLGTNQVCDIDIAILLVKAGGHGYRRLMTEDLI